MLIARIEYSHARFLYLFGYENGTEKERVNVNQETKHSDKRRERVRERKKFFLIPKIRIMNLFKYVSFDCVLIAFVINHRFFVFALIFDIFKRIYHFLSFFHLCARAAAIQLAQLLLFRCEPNPFGNY